MNKTCELVLVYLLCAVYSVYAMGLVMFHLVQEGLRAVRVSPRDKPPPVLSDHKWGHHQYIQLKKQGVKLHYVQKGENTKPLMVFLHGFPECWLSWRHQLQEFSSQYWVVAVDLRGYGDSDKPKGKQNYTLNQVAEDVKELVTELGKPSCTLVGHDWGGVIGWALVERHPDLFNAFVCLNGPHRGVLATLIQSSFKQFKMSWYIFFFQCPFLPEIVMRLKDLSFYTSALRGPENLTTAFPDDVIEGYHYYYSKPGAFTYPLHYYRNLLTDHNTHSPTIKGKITVPILILWGEKDMALSAEIPKQMLPLCEDASYEGLADSGHFLHEENPKEVNQRIWKYLNTKKLI